MSIEFLVDMESAESFVAANNKHILGRLRTDYGQIIQSLINKTLKLFVVCTPSRAGLSFQKRSNVPEEAPCSLEIVIYCSSDVSKDISS